MSMTETTTVDFDAIKQRQQGTWSSGDYAVIGTTLQLDGRVALRGPRRRRRRAGARRRRRQRQRRARRRPPWLRGHRDRLRAGAAGRDACQGGGRGPDDRRARGGRRGAAVRRRELRRRRVDVRRDVHPEPGAGRRPSCCGSAGRVAGSASRTGRRRASSARCSRSSVATCRLRPASAPRWSGARRPGSAELFGADARVEVQRREFVFRYRSAEHWLAAFRDYYGPTYKAFGALDEDGPGGVRRRPAGPRQQPQHVDHGHAPRPERVPRGRRRQGRGSRGRNPQPAPPVPFSPRGGRRRAPRWSPRASCRRRSRCAAPA